MKNYHKEMLFIDDVNSHNPFTTFYNLLDEIRLNGAVLADLTIQSNWAVELTQTASTVVIYYIVSGKCHVQIDVTEKKIIEAGDFFISSKPFNLIMADNLNIKAIPLKDFVSKNTKHRSTIENQLISIFTPSFVQGVGDPTRIITFRMYLNKNKDIQILKDLPKYILMKGYYKKNKFFIDQCIKLIKHEGKKGFSGQIATSRISETLLSKTLEDYLSINMQKDNGFISALYDKNLNTVLKALHEAPELNWDLDQLAKISNLSRTSFIEKFTEKLGITPKKYLINLRMKNASDYLKNTNMSVFSIALNIGYKTESSFSRAFQTWAKATPSQYRSSFQAK